LLASALRFAAVWTTRTKSQAGNEMAKTKRKAKVKANVSTGALSKARSVYA
jgi:hypothetical protein